MANNYVSFCEELPIHNQDERDWWQHVLSFDPDDHDDPTTQFELVSGVKRVKFDYGGLEVQADLEDDKVILYSDDYGDVDLTAMLVQAFLRRFDPTKNFILRYAAYCSKTRVGEFGGGALVVTAQRIEPVTGWVAGEYVAPALASGGDVLYLRGPELELLKRLLRDPLSDALSGGGDVSQSLAKKLGMEGA